MRRSVSKQTPTTHLKNLQRIPGIGPSLALDLWDLGYHCVTDLAQQDAEQMYRNLEQLRGQPMDPCVLYTFRCAVYFASTDERDPMLLKWWNWKTPPASHQATKGATTAASGVGQRCVVPDALAPG
jgi:hypothetical protein